MTHLVAYDIADPKRLRRVARFMERRGLRVQKSVFLTTGDADDVERLLDQAAILLDPEHDVVQAWRLTPGQPSLGAFRGAPLNVTPAGLVLGPTQRLSLDPS